MDPTDASPAALTSTRRRLLASLASSLLGVPVARAAASAPASTSASSAPRAGPPYRFTPVPQQAIGLVAGYWNPILAWVSAHSGVALELKLARTSQETTAYVLHEEADFVFTNHLFSPEREQLGWKVFGRRVTPPVRGQIVVPTDSPITTLAGLQGQEVVFPGAEALVAYKVPYTHLLAEKIDIHPVFGGNMDGALAQLFSRRVVAAGVNSQLVEAYARREGRTYRVLWSSEPFLDLALMASSRVPPQDVAAVAGAFAHMHDTAAGRDVLAEASRQIGLEADAHFALADGSEYGAYRRFYQSAPASLR